MNALTKVEAMQIMHSFDDMERMAIAMAKANIFGVKTPEQALGLMLVAQAEGQHPASITQDYDIIQGKATRKTHSVLARFQAAGGRVEWHELNDQTAEATFTHPQGGALRLAWTFAMAQKAKLTGKDNWQGYPRAMLRARLIAEGVRAVYPAAIGGYLVPEEAMDMPPGDVPPRQSAGPKDMGMAEVVDYPADEFTKNLESWAKVVASGRKTVEEIAAMAASKGKGALTADQTAKLTKAAEDLKAPAAPKVTYAQVADQLQKAQSQQEANDAAGLIAAVADEQQRVELTGIYEQRIADLQA